MGLINRLARMGLLALALCAALAQGGQPVRANLPPPIRVMPLGDSITSSVDEPVLQASYRCWLYKQMVTAGYSVDFVGSLWGIYEDTPPPSPCETFDADHEGHYGYRADQILENITVWAQMAQPDVVLIHLGHNDLWYHQSIESTIAELEQIIDRLRAVNPNVKILLAKLIPSSVGGELDRIPLLNAQIPSLAARKHTLASPVRVVDQYTGFNPALDTLDGVHPNESGEKKMAARWFGVFNVLLNGKAVAYLPLVGR